MMAEQRMMEEHSALIVGCGYVGLELTRQLAADQWRVWGMRRSPDAAEAIRQAGAEPIIGDIRSADKVLPLPPVDFAASLLAPGHADDYQDTYVQGAEALVRLFKEKKLKRLVWVSSTSVYGRNDGGWVDEETPPEPATDRAWLLLKAEEIILRSRLPALVLRLGGIYGPGRMRKPADPPAQNEAVVYMNSVHVVDAAAMIRHLFQHGQPGEIYLGVDGRPLARRPDAQTDRRTVSNKRCSNAKITALGYRFQFPARLP